MVSADQLQRDSDSAQRWEIATVIDLARADGDLDVAMRGGSERGACAAVFVAHVAVVVQVRLAQRACRSSLSRQADRVNLRWQ
jgi:hypothetical protein